jgi:hypothetical protein
VEKMAYKEVKGDEPKKDDNEILWEPEAEGEFMEGTYIEKEEDVGKFKSNMYDFKDGDKTIKVWGSKILDDLMDKVELKSKIMIKFNGTGNGKNGPYKKYRVFEDDGTDDPDESAEPTKDDDFEVKDSDAANQIENYMNRIRKIKGNEEVTAWEIINFAELEELPKDDMQRLKLQLAELVKAKKIPQGEKPE